MQRSILGSEALHKANVGLLALILATLYVMTQTVLHAMLESIEDEGNVVTESFGANVRPIAKHMLKRDEGSSNKNPKTKRNFYEEHHPPNDMNRVRNFVKGLRVPTPATHAEDVPYEIYNCPPVPPPNYPYAWLLVDNLQKDWSVDDTDIPSTVYQSICVFDWDTDFDKAQAYREAEVPFVVRNNPELLRASERWNYPDYLLDLIGPKPVRTEYSKNNHLKFWRPAEETPEGWEPPEVEIEMTFSDFVQKSEELYRHKQDQASREHWYFRLKADLKGQSVYLYDELPMFIPGEKPSFFMIIPEQDRGINCRLGMLGNVAEMHFDPMRNFVVVMGGQRRYIIAHPNQCKNIELHPFGHPSARHSSMNWSAPPGPDYTGPFRSALASELVMQAGDALYVPDSWLHFVVALSKFSYQCNVRSGLDQSEELATLIKDCGFPMYAWPETLDMFGFDEEMFKSKA